jgi:HSF-type DNA-binding
MNTFFCDLLKDNHNHGDNMSNLDTLIYNLLLKYDRSSLDHKRNSITWHFTKQLILQEQSNSLRTKLLLAMHIPIVAALDPNYALSPERRFTLRTQAVTNLGYSEALQHIQDQESLLLNQLKRNANADSSPLTAQSLYTSPLIINTQKDTQSDKSDEDPEIRSSTDPNTKIRNQRDPTHSFPSRLHEILSNPEYSECITWLPHGRSWKILRRTQFECLVIPRHFRHGKYSSFMRQV